MRLGLIGDGGENTLMFTGDAIALARQRGLDLVEVAPNENPPVCKLMDYGKFRYEQTKKDRELAQDPEAGRAKGSTVKPQNRRP